MRTFQEWLSGKENTRDNEYRIRHLIRRSPTMSGMGELYDAHRRELKDRLAKARTYRKLTDDEEVYAK